MRRGALRRATTVRPIQGPEASARRFSQARRAAQAQRSARSRLRLAAARSAGQGTGLQCGDRAGRLHQLALPYRSDVLRLHLGLQPATTLYYLTSLSPAARSLLGFPLVTIVPGRI